MSLLKYINTSYNEWRRRRLKKKKKWYYDECVRVSSVSTVCACAIRRRSISLSYRIEISSIASWYESAWRWTRLKMVPK